MSLENELINPEVKRKLEILQETPPRENEKVKAGRRNFLSLASSMKKPVSIAPEKRLNKWISKLYRKDRRSMITAITTLVISIVFIFGGASATVFAAQDSTPDNLLYEVKTWSEDLQLSLTKNPQAQFDMVEGYVLRRFTETDSMIEEAKPIPPRLVTRLENQLNYMLQLASQLKDNGEIESALIRIRSMLQDRIQLMTSQRENVPEWVIPAYAQIQQRFNERLRIIETGIEDPQNNRQQMENPAGGFGPGPGTESDNPEVINPTPTGKAEDKPLGSGACDKTLENCSGVGEPEDEPLGPGADDDPQEDSGGVGEPEFNSPSESSGKSSEDRGNQNSSDSSNQGDNSGDGKGTGGKP